MRGSDVIHPDYYQWVDNLKQKIHSAQIKAALSVNHELIQLYLELGTSISLKLKEGKWGSSVIEKLSSDLKKDFPDQKGFSRSNLFYMKRFAEFYTAHEKVQQLVGQIPWGHNIVIFTKSNWISLRGLAKRLPILGIHFLNLILNWLLRL